MYCLTPLHLAYIAAHPLPPATPRMAALDRTTCIDPAQLGRAEGLTGTFAVTTETEHFVLAWNEGEVTEAQVDTYVLALETSWSVEIDSMGWMEPSQTDACRITVLIAEFDKGTGGYTNVKEDGGVPYMVLNTAWLAYGDDWTYTLVAHEFNHASQFAYDVFWDESDWWYWEATAEWSTDLVYDDANTYIWSLWSYLDAPWRSLDSQAATVQYGHFAFNTHLEEGYSTDMPREVWEAAGSGSVSEAVAAATLDTFDTVVTDYSSRVAAFDVEESDVWFEALGYLVSLGYEVDPWTHVSTYPSSGSVTGREAPQEGGQTFFHLSGTPGGIVTFALAGASTVGSATTNFVVTVATVTSAGTTHTSTPAVDGVATVTVAGIGSDVTDAYLAVVPLGDIGEEGAEFDWTVSATPDAEDTDDPPDEDEEAVACGCSAPMTTLPFAALFPVFFVLRSRRR